jgi:predicted O-methyltransferase YrrM
LGNEGVTLSTLKNRFDLARHFNELGFKVGAEIGVADGYYSEALCRHIPGLELYCIDPWKKYAENPRGGSQDRQTGNHVKAVERLAKYDAHLIQMTSVQADDLFQWESLDFVFIDGHHGYEYVKKDVDMWSDNVRKGGIVAGHDYYQFDNSGVIEAVNEYTSQYGIDLNIIPEDPRRSKRDDQHPCFWWVKS